MSRPPPTASGDIDGDLTTIPLLVDAVREKLRFEIIVEFRDIDDDLATLPPSTPRLLEETLLLVTPLAAAHSFLTMTSPPFMHKALSLTDSREGVEAGSIMLSESVEACRDSSFSGRSRPTHTHRRVEIITNF